MENKKKPQIQDVPTTDFVGIIKIGKAEIPCAVLYPETENPIRVIVQREVVGLLTGNKKGGLERYLKPDNLRPYLPEKFKDKDLSKSTHLFKSANGRIAQGFEGDDLIDICKMYMQARTDRKLLATQKHLAVQAEIIVFAFAKTGVAGVIDNVTGYEEFRPRFALNRLFEKYVEEEARKWVKRFPDKFYELIFKLNGWPYNEETIKKQRPSIIGKWTNDIIYARFPKGVLAKLKDKNPITDTGHRRYKYHQLLTDIGNDELQEYISNAMFLMSASSNWRKFLNTLARALGKTYQGEIWE